MCNIANIDCTDYKKESADFRQHLQGSPQATIQLVRACTIIVHTLNMYCFALNFPRW